MRVAIWIASVCLLVGVGWLIGSSGRDAADTGALREVPVERESHPAPIELPPVEREPVPPTPAQDAEPMLTLVQAFEREMSAQEAAHAALARLPVELFADLDEGWHPTPDGLFAQTVDMWSQPGFIELSTERALDLLPVADDEIGTFPTTIFALTGGFPTLHDCEVAYRSDEVRAAHLEFLKVETLVTELQLRPSAERTQVFEATLNELRVIRDEAELAMMRACDRATSFKNWTLVHRLYREWAK